MADEKAEFRAAVARLRNGSSETIEAFVSRYGPAILRIARRNLSSSIRSKFDSRDFTQMVWVSFFRNPEDIKSFATPNELMAYLTRMVLNKIHDEHRRRLQSQKHNVKQECPIDAVGEPANIRVDSPSQIAIAREVWEQLLDGASERDRAIARLRLDGATFVEIAHEIGIHERFARRIVKRLFHNHQRRLAHQGS